MADYNFYINPSGSNTNAGSTAADASGSDSPSVTSTNGNWDATTRIFTAAGGATPFSGVTPGEWVSICADSATATTYIGQITSVGLTGTDITISSTNNLGTAPSTSANGRTCRVGGAWASFDLARSTSGNLFNSGVSNSAFGLFVNVKKATYANTTNSLSINIANSGVAQVRFTGYNSTPGDLDTPSASRAGNRNGGNLPSITFTTGSCGLSGSQNRFENLDFYTSSTSSTNVVNCNGSHNVIHRCQIEHAQANANAFAISLQGTGCTLSSSYLKATTTASYVVNVGGNTPRIVGNYITGGVAGLNTATTSTYVAYCIFTGAASYGITTGADNLIVDNCLFYAPGADGIRINTFGHVLVSNCAFVDCGGYDINNNTGTSNTQRLQVYNCSTYSPTSGHTNISGGGDWYEKNTITETSSPLTGGTAPPLVTGALSLGAGLPGYYEGTAYQAGMDIGFQNVASGGGGTGNIRIGGILTQ